ncbi:hypothetical protein [Streptomyces sp. NPDC051183]|uniref:hypothetical protein n=1 Tax=unclassified Streptomyces TaxID=2593676 RepID=UPI00341992C9
MTLKEGQRVELAADTRLTELLSVTGAVAGVLSLAAGTEGTVERVVEHDEQSHEVREYLRLKSLLDAFGHEMPTASKRQLEEEVGSLEPAWIAYQEQRGRVTVRVRFDNGFVLDDAHENLFAPA